MAYTQVDFGKPAAATFRFKPPKGTDVIEEKAHGKKFREHRSEHGRKSGKFEKFHKGEKGGKFDKGERPGMTGMTGLNTLGDGWGAVAVIKGPKSADPPKGEKSKESGEARDMLGTFTDEVKGNFGTGHGLQHPSGQRPDDGRRHCLRRCRDQGRSDQGRRRSH